MLQLTTIIFLISFSLLAVLHIIALELFLYWRYVWFDLPMHMLGGAVVALGIFTLYDLRLRIPRSFLTPRKVLACVFLVACMWEVFEVLIGIPIDETYVLDTTFDLVMGLFGGYMGFIVANNIRNL